MISILLITKDVNLGHVVKGAICFSTVKLLFSLQSPSHPQLKGRGIQLHSQDGGWVIKNLWSYVKIATVVTKFLERFF